MNREGNLRFPLLRDEDQQEAGRRDQVSRFPAPRRTPHPDANTIDQLSFDDEQQQMIMVTADDIRDILESERTSSDNRRTMRIAQINESSEESSRGDDEKTDEERSDRRSKQTKAPCK